MSQVAIARWIVASQSTTFQSHTPNRRRSSQMCSTKISTMTSSRWCCSGDFICRNHNYTQINNQKEQSVYSDCARVAAEGLLYLRVGNHPIRHANDI